MVLDPQVKVLLGQMEASEAPALESLPPVQAREAFKQLNENLDANPDPVHNH